MADFIDYCNRKGAEILAKRIEEYWRARGDDVTVYLEEGGFLAAMRSGRTDVRSNLVDGLPRKTKDTK